MPLPSCTTFEYLPGRYFDIYEPPSSDSSVTLPTLLYLPGGGLVDSSRKQPTSLDRIWLIENTLKRGCVFISAEYPHLRATDGQGIIEGIQTLLSAIQTHLAHLVDVTRLGMYASSAGCFIAVQATLLWPVKPRALGLGWQMGSHFLTNPWWLEPWSEIKGFFERLPPDNFLIRLLREGTYLDRFTGEQGITARLRSLPPADRATGVPDHLRVLFPELHIASTEYWPPTFMCHGLQDTATSCDESRHLAALLSDREDIQLRLVPDADHGLEGGKDAQRVREEMLDFVLSRIEPRR